jgi:hypothetical protein
MVRRKSTRDGWRFYGVLVASGSIIALYKDNKTVTPGKLEPD